MSLDAASQSSPLWPLVVYVAMVVLLVAGMMALSHVLGERGRRDRATVEPFESGIVPLGYARFRLSIKFYLVAMFFVIFDLEAVFLYAWAVSVREVGWAGYAEALVFIGILVAALVYLWRLGALDWVHKDLTRRLPARRQAARSRSASVSIPNAIIAPIGLSPPPSRPARERERQMEHGG